MLITPYFRTIMDFKAGGCVEEPNSNYNPYNIFCLMSRLEYFANNRNKNYMIKPISVPLDNRMVLTIKIFDEKNDEVKLATEDEQRYQSAINEITSNHPNHCLLLTSKGLNKYPLQWLNSIVPYLVLDPSYNSYLEREVIYANLSSVDFYMDTYNVTLMDLLNQVKTLYQQGAMITNAPFARKWGLRPQQLPSSSDAIADVDSIDEWSTSSDSNTKELQQESISSSLASKADKKVGLYIPLWSNNEIAPDRIEFFYQRSAELPVKFNVGLNLVTRYYIALRVPNIIFDGVWCILPKVTTINKVKSYASLISELAHIATGKVATIPLASLENVEELKVKAHELYKGIDPVVYETTDRLRPYTLSFLIPLGTDPATVARLVQK